MKIIQGIAVLISILIILTLSSVWYLKDWRSSSEMSGKKTLIDLGYNDVPENASVAELADALNIYRFKDPWEAPDFELALLEGPRKSLSDYRGKYVLLTFWTTW